MGQGSHHPLPLSAHHGPQACTGLEPPKTDGSRPEGGVAFRGWSIYKQAISAGTQEGPPSRGFPFHPFHPGVVSAGLASPCLGASAGSTFPLGSLAPTTRPHPLRLGKALWCCFAGFAFT